MNGKFKWIVSLLAVSLLANIFAVGMFLGKEFKGERTRKGKPPSVEFNLRRLGEHLSEEDQLAVRGIIRAERGDLRQLFRQMKDSEDTIRSLLTDEIVDKDALKLAIEGHAGLMQGMRRPFERILIEIVAELDQEKRKAVAEELFMFERGKRGPGRRFGPPPGGRGGPPPHEQPDDMRDFDLPPPPPERGPGERPSEEDDKPS